MGGSILGPFSPIERRSSSEWMLHQGRNCLFQLLRLCKSTRTLVFPVITNDRGHREEVGGKHKCATLQRRHKVGDYLVVK